MISYITRNIFTRVVFVLTALSLASLAHTQELPVAAANTLEQMQLLVGTTGNGRLRTPDGDVVFKDEDILKYDLQQQTWSVYFDGSDVGILGDVNAFSTLSDGSMLLSLEAPARIADLGLIDDSDILHFQPDSTGEDTSGTLSIYFDGSDVGLTTANEDIHALSVLDNGNLLISTNGNNSVPGVNAADEDLLEFSPTTLGAETTGTWTLYFDGSDVDLTRSSEDIWALSAVGSDLHLATQGTFSADGIQGGRADVLLCAALLQSDQPNFCKYSIFTRGQDIGFGTKPIDSMEILVDSNNTDSTAPTGVAAIAPAANEFDWHNSNVTVNLSWSDAGGIDFDNCTTQSDITTEGATVRYSAFCSDLSGNVSEITGSIAIDKQQPETNITSLPTVVDAGINITFEGTDSLSGIDRFECSLNEDGFVPCTSPQRYENLNNGNYNVEVRSIDRAGNTDQTADSQSWVVDSSDLTAPIASPVFAPIANALDWHSTDVVVTFNWTDDDGLNTNSCTASTVVVNEGASLQYTGSCDDINGNTGSSTGTVSIDRTAPVTAIFASPVAVTSSTTATFEFTGTDNLSGIAAYECQLDGNGYTLCTSPTSYQNLASGSHVFEVRAVDIADNQQTIPAELSWTVEEVVTDADAAAKASRFLQMASLAATEDDIKAVINNGMENWLNNQIALIEPGSRFDWLLDNGYKVSKNVTRGFDFAVWERLFTAENVVRQRWTLALSEIFVVGVDGLTGSTGWKPFAGAAYLDMLEEKGLGNYRDLLEEVTLNLQMGEYLSLKGSKKRDGTGRAPDENYAREVLQLFSIGLHELNDDGTFTLDANGRPIETYDNDDIVELAKALTGWSNNFTTADVIAGPDHHRQRMIMQEDLHDTTEATFLGTTIAANTNGELALQIALDAIAGHDNVGPFLAAQFIQRLVTSNPSPAYVQRVASVFNSDEFGVRGNLAAVLKAVLLDPEALDQSPVNDNQKGKLREPILRFIQWGRTFNLNDPTGAWIIYSTSSAQSQLGQSPLRSPSVFNFFRPDYIPPNSSLRDLGLTAPELQITNETSIAGYANFMHRKVSTGFSGTVRPDYSAELQLANDPEALVSRLNLLLAANQLTPETADLITSTVDSMSSSNSDRLEQRVHAAILMVMLSPDYLVLR